MGQFAYDFSLVLLHSLWQSALLLLLYKVNLLLIKQQQPCHRRNVLFCMLLIQVLLSAVTYIIYATEVDSLQPAFLQVSILISAAPTFENAFPLIFSLYLCIVLYKTALLFYHWNRFKTNCGNSLQKASLDHRSFVIRKTRELGIGKKVTLWYSNKISSPITFGFFKPIVLLPVALLNQLTVKEAEMLILHELTHIKNNDYLFNFILIACETVFFFNPFIKQLCALVKLEREKNCDVEVIQSAYSSLTYAEALLKIARFKSEVNMFHLAAASDNKQLLKRVKFFTSENNLRFNKSKYAPIIFLFIALLFILNFFTITEFNRKPGAGGYEYIASTIPGYNAYSLTTSFSDVNNSEVVKKTVNYNNTITLQKDKGYKKKNITPPPRQEYVAIYPLEAQEIIDSDESQFMPVANSDVTPQETKEFIFNEENSAGNKVTRAYKMILLDGKWIAEPLWMYTENKLRVDSLVIKDSVNRRFHIIQ